jgi:hypothetical protein
MGKKAGKPGETEQGHSKKMSDVLTANYLVRSIGGSGRVSETIYRAARKLSDMFPHKDEPQKQWSERRLRGWWNKESDCVRHWQMVELYEAAARTKEERELLRKAREEHAQFIEKTARIAALLELADEDFHREQIEGFRSLAVGLDSPGIRGK